MQQRTAVDGRHKDGLRAGGKAPAAVANERAQGLAHGGGAEVVDVDGRPGLSGAVC